MNGYSAAFQFEFTREWSSATCGDVRPVGNAGGTLGPCVIPRLLIRGLARRICELASGRHSRDPFLGREIEYISLPAPESFEFRAYFRRACKTMVHALWAHTCYMREHMCASYTRRKRESSRKFQPRLIRIHFCLQQFFQPNQVHDSRPTTEVSDCPRKFSDQIIVPEAELLNSYSIISGCEQNFLHFAQFVKNDNLSCRFYQSRKIQY